MKKRNPYEIILANQLESYEVTSYNATKYVDNKFENTSIQLEHPVEFNGCVFERVQFIGDFRKAQFIDCVLNRCDISNADFEASRFHRVKLDGSKGLGTRFTKAKWQYMTITDSVLNYGEFADVDFQDIVITKSDLSQSSFFTANLQRVSLNNVNLTQTDFSDTPLNGIDLSLCDINGIRVSSHCLKGVRVNPTQAIALIRLFGVEVTE
jgi:uncharacterized protein YjbI with pentapeptide repeats